MRGKFRLTYIVAVFLIGTAIWYLFIKPWDYILFFTVDAPHTVVYQGIHDWHEWNRKTIQKGRIGITEKEPWNKITTKLELNDTLLYFNWKVTQKNDSVTLIKVRVTDDNRKLYNRITIPFGQTPFKKSIKKNVLLLKHKLDQLEQSYRFNYIGPGEIKELECVYISTKSQIKDKAREMIMNVIALNQFVKSNHLGLNGNPMVQVENWAPENDSINFDFCFPILHPELMPEDPVIKLKTISVPHAIKAEFYGNYSISDLAWNLLKERAQKMDIQTTGQITEVFYNDPHSGGNDLKWKAEIFLATED